MSLYLKIEDAESLLFSDGVTRVRTATEFMDWQAQQVASRGIARVWNYDKDVKARVNHGRWITDCQACYSGVYTHPTWRIACCANCGAVYRDVQFPEAIVKITRLLLDRPNRENQNWEPGESIHKIRLENIFHHLSVTC